MPQHDTRATETTTNTSTSTEVASTEGGAQELVGNQALVDIIKARNNPVGELAPDPGKTGIIHFGLNEHAADEAKALNRANRGRGGALSIRNQPEQDKVAQGGTTFDLATQEGAASYVATLGLPDQQAVNAAQFIVDTGSMAKDEIALLIKAYAQAELGARTMERLVLSGHSVGSQIWGDDNGWVPFEHLEALSRIFPKATAQVKHLMLSACYSGGEAKMGQYHAMFPNLASITAYHDSSPGTWSGAIDHLEAWEGRTEDGKDPAGVDPEMAAGFRKDKNMSTWNEVDGYQGAKPMGIRDILGQLSSQESVFNDHFSGAVEVTDSQAGPLRDYYNVVQRLLGHAEATSDQQAQYGGRRDVTIRLLYWQVINDKFMHAHGQTIQDAYTEVGQEMPDFANMGRGEALRAIEAFEAAGGGGSALDLLGRGLRDLSPDVILTNWV